MASGATFHPASDRQILAYPARHHAPLPTALTGDAVNAMIAQVGLGAGGWQRTAVSLVGGAGEARQEGIPSAMDSNASERLLETAREHLQTNVEEAVSFLGEAKRAESWKEVARYVQAFAPEA